MKHTQEYKKLKTLLILRYFIWSVLLMSLVYNIGQVGVKLYFNTKFVIADKELAFLELEKEKLDLEIDILKFEVNKASSLTTVEARAKELGFIESESKKINIIK